ncbi:1-deoxy-D-xylulose-5-phosphate reductoisomerase [Xanthomonadaceae bacterium JHOS43]|nr:1-deoxy-D-xylulose-5-phosphate reductoisomerase [Xanthomonadaceae bacterium JHOS43]
MHLDQEQARGRIAVFGATGSIGASTLDVIARHPSRFRASVLSAHQDVEGLIALCVRFRPDIAIIASEAHYTALRDGLAQAGLGTRPMAGSQALSDVAGSDACDTVVAAIVGAAGLGSTLAAARAGKRILLANKESIVVAGALLMRAVAESGAELLPVDSEHNAIYQCLPTPAIGAAARPGVRRVVLTASGGPFRGWRREQLANVTPEQACAHPNWRMGRKISVDSATLMNKGLEVIEAHWLFNAAPDAIEVVVHPQSIVHSLVDYVDGSTLAQLGNPDMRTALAYGLAWPERIEAGVPPLDLAAIGRLEFQPPDERAFPCLRLAREALREGPGATTVLNAANEVAVSAFLQGGLRFLGIPEVLQSTLARLHERGAGDLPSLLELDKQARRLADSLIRHEA